MDPITIFLTIIALHLITGVINFINCQGLPKENQCVVLGFFPVIAQVLVIGSVYSIIVRLIKSKGKCGHGHRFVLQSFEGEPSVPGSFRVYMCEKCLHKDKVYWPSQEEIKKKWGWDN